MAFRDSTNNLYLTGVPTTISSNVSMYALDQEGIMIYYNTSNTSINLYTGATQKIYTGTVASMGHHQDRTAGVLQ